MEYMLRDDVLMERGAPSEEWRPVPVSRLGDAAAAVLRQQQAPPVGSAPPGAGNLSARIIRRGEG